MIASLERCSTVPSWLRASCADFSVASSVRPVRKTSSSRSITARSRSVLASVTTSRAPSAIASAMSASSTCGASSSRSMRPTSRKRWRSEEHTSELQSPCNLVCRLLLEKKKNTKNTLFTPEVQDLPQKYLLTIHIHWSLYALYASVKVTLQTHTVLIGSALPRVPDSIS